MKDKLYIGTKLDEELSTFIPGSEEKNELHKNKAEIWMWVYNEGKLRTEHEINVKLTHLNEEIMAMEYTGIVDNNKLKILNAKIKILQDVLN